VKKNQIEFERGFVPSVDFKTEDWLKQKHNETMWTTMTKEQEGHCTLESEEVIR